ncbi:hypothetical protein KY284_032658 [Solanum tuberosum]|nr:hypothetical protein KY284_032658 [Solanum tuberosum]
MFNPEEEMTIAIAWISFPGLPLIFFVKQAIFSLAAAVGNPLQVDMATQNQTRPCYARVKQSGEVVEKWIRIKYDYVPKYCVNYRLQGHNEQECYALHPELYPKKNEVVMENGMEKQENKGHKEMGQPLTEGEKHKLEREGIMNKSKEQFQIHRNKRHQEKLRPVEQRGRMQVWNPKPKHMEMGKEGWTNLNNQFEALKDTNQSEEITGEKTNTKVEVSTRNWVKDNFTNNEALGNQSADHERMSEGQSIDDETQHQQVEKTRVLNKNKGTKIMFWKPENEREKDSTTIPDPICIVEPNSGDKSISYIHDMTPTQKQSYQDEREDEDMEMNIQSASKACDLSPRQMEELKSG